MGFFNDDRLAGQLKSSVGSELGFGTANGQHKFRMELIGQARSSAGGCKLARSLSQLQARPPKPSSTACVRSWRSPARSHQQKPRIQPAPTSIPQPYCMCAFMAHASSLVPAKTCLQPASNLIFFFEETIYLEHAERPNATRRAGIPRVRRALRAPLQTSDARPQNFGTRLD